jgi:hypothetical protein
LYTNVLSVFLRFPCEGPVVRGNTPGDEANTGAFPVFELWVMGEDGGKVPPEVAAIQADEVCYCIQAYVGHWRARQIDNHSIGVLFLVVFEVRFHDFNPMLFNSIAQNHPA